MSYNSPIRSYRFLFTQLLRVNIIGRYRRSWIGGFWVLLAPIFNTAIWLLLNFSGIMNPGDTGIPYPAYLLISTSLWQLFISSFILMSENIQFQGKLLLIHPFPPEVLVMERLAANVFNFAIPLILNIIVLACFGVTFGWGSILFPIFLIPIVLLGSSVGMVVSAFKMIVLDLGILIEEGMKILQYLTPVVFAPGFGNEWFVTIVNWNPLTHLLVAARDCLVYGKIPLSPTYWSVVGFSLIVFLISRRFYRKAVPRIIERIFNG